MTEVWTEAAQLADRRRRIKTTSLDDRISWLAGALELARESGALEREHRRRVRAAGPEVEAFDRVRTICHGFRDVERSSLQGRPLFRVGKRRFAIFNSSWAPERPRWAGQGCSLHFLADTAEADALRADPRFSASPHHGDRGWFALRLHIDDVDWDEVAELLASAHAQVTKRTTHGST